MMTDAMKQAMGGTPTGTTLKVIGQTRARQSAGSEWLSAALHELHKWLRDLHQAGHNKITMDDFRQAGCVAEPRSANAWGSLPKAAVRAGLLSPTSRSAPAKRPSAHARRVRLWRIREGVQARRARR